MKAALALLLMVAATRAELAIEVPIETPTNVPGSAINVPAPLRGHEPTNDELPPAKSPTVPATVGGPPLRRVTEAAGGEDSLTFTNGDLFTGRFLGYDDGLVRWQSPVVKEPIRFRAAGLDELAVAAGIGGKNPPAVAWLVFLADGSLWPARQVTVAEGHVTADLAHAGRVRLECRQVAALRRCGKGASEWVTLGDAPLYAPPASDHGQSLRYRDTKLPDPLLVEFPWSRGLGTAVNLRVFAGKPEDLNRSPSSFYLNFSRTGANARYLSAQGERGPVAMLAEPFTNRSARATTWVGLAVNRKSGEVALYLDGQLHRRGMLIGPLTVPDFGLSVPENDLTRLAPRAVLVSRVNDDLAVPAPPADQDAVRLANGDQLAGRLEAVSTNELVFHAAVGRVALPLERVAQITFAPSAPVTPRAVEAQVGLHDGTLLRGVWQRADAQSVVVQHAALGAVSFPRPALAEVDYRAETAGEVDWLAERLAARRMALRGGLFGLGLRRLYERTYRPGLIQLQPNAQWHGDLLAITNGVVRWQHPAALDPFVLPVAEVQRVSPLLRPVPVTPVAERATARLANGDVISGLLAGADGDAVRLTPWYAGPLAIPRRQVTQLTPHAPVAGALDLQPSTPGIVTDGAYWFGGRDCLQRRGALPDRLRLDLELVWSSQPGRAQVYLFSRGDPLELKDAPEYLNATFTPYGVHLRACVKDQAANTNFAAGLFTNLVAGGYVTLTVLADRPNRHLRLLVDGHQVGEWRGMDIAAPTGDGVMVFGDGWSGTAVRHVVLREWRDEPVAAPCPRPVTPAPRSPADARVVLHNGDFLTLTDVTADSRQLTGRHKLLGPVNVALVAVRLLEWERPRPVNR